MAFTTPATYSTGELMTATKMNLIRDNILALKDPPSDVITLDTTNYTLSSVTWTAIDSTNLSISLDTVGGVIEVGFMGVFNYTAGGNRNGKLDIYIDGVAMFGDDGVSSVGLTTAPIAPGVGFVVRKEGLTAGTHVIRIYWKCGNAADTFTLYAGAGTAQADNHPHFWAIER